MHVTFREEKFIELARVVQKVNSAIHQINHYPADNTKEFSIVSSAVHLLNYVKEQKLPVSRFSIFNFKFKFQMKCFFSWCCFPVVSSQPLKGLNFSKNATHPQRLNRDNLLTLSYDTAIVCMIHIIGGGRGGEGLSGPHTPRV